MTTTIILPDDLAQQLQQHAMVRRRSAEALAIEYIAAALTEEATPQIQANLPPLDADTELLALVAQIKAMPPNPQSIIPAKGNLADVLRAMEAIEYESNLEAESVALRDAEEELRAINRADDIAEGRG
jgi:plasmid stability protein